MVVIEPMERESRTAFKERYDTINKVNEIINYLNYNQVSMYHYDAIPDIDNLNDKDIIAISFKLNVTIPANPQNWGTSPSTAITFNLNNPTISYCVIGKYDKTNNRFDYLVNEIVESVSSNAIAKVTGVIDAYDGIRIQIYGSYFNASACKVSTPLIIKKGTNDSTITDVLVIRGGI